MKLDFDAKNYQDFQRIEINVSNGVAIQSAFITDQNITTHYLEEKEGDQLEKKVFVPLESIFKTNNIFSILILILQAEKRNSPIFLPIMNWEHFILNPRFYLLKRLLINPFPNNRIILKSKY